MAMRANGRLIRDFAPAVGTVKCCHSSRPGSGCLLSPCRRLQTCLILMRQSFSDFSQSRQCLVLRRNLRINLLGMSLSLLKRFLHRAPCGCETHCQSLIQLGAKTAERVLQVLPCRPAQVLCVADHDGVDLFE